MKKKSTIQKRKEIVFERIEILKEMINKKPEYENRYRQLIKRLAKKYRLKIDF